MEVGRVGSTRISKTEEIIRNTRICQRKGMGNGDKSNITKAPKANQIVVSPRVATSITVNIIERRSQNQGKYSKKVFIK